MKNNIIRNQNYPFLLIKNIFSLKMNSKPVWKIEKIVLPQHADHAGVMWHGTYFNWLEESRINALLEVGISYFELTKKGFDLPLIDTSIKYKSPLFLGEKITIMSVFNIDKSPRINVISVSYTHLRAHET